MIEMRSGTREYWGLWSFRLVRIAFGLAALAKLFAFQNYLDAIELTTLWPKTVVYVVGPLFVGCEVAAAISIVHRGLQRIGSLIALLLSVSLVSYNLWRAVDHSPVPCSCFGPLLKSSPEVSLGLSFLLACLALYSNSASGSTQRTDGGN